MKRFFLWLISLFVKKVTTKVEETFPEPVVPPCSLVPDFRRKMAARRPKPIKPKPTPTEPTEPTPIPTEPTPTEPTPTSPTTTGNMLYFNFTGRQVQYSSWNGGQSFNCAASTLVQADRDQALYAAQYAYAPWNIIVTASQAQFDAHTGPKQEVIVTPSSSWYPNTSYSGVAHIGSFGRAGDVAFVFEDRLGFRWDFVGDIMIHESGHTFGLYHQSQYDPNCVLVASYRSGCHMGYPFNLDAQWVTGTSYSCTAIQNDNAILDSKLGRK